MPIGSVFRASLNRTCDLTIKAYTNSSVAVIKVKWASLDIVFEYQALGYVNGIPVIAPRSLRARSTLGGGVLEAVGRRINISRASTALLKSTATSTD
ncbi:MAG: hypothetical protein QXR18_10265 [Pyrobaculum sp.]